MGNKIIEGLWDCTYCGTTAIGGLTKHCPVCGHPQDADTRFYLGEQKHYLEDEIAKEYGQGADWTCTYCKSLNRVHFQYCAYCGAPKEGAETSYFENVEKAEQKARSVQSAAARNNSSSASPKKGGGFPKLLIPILIVLGLLIAFFAMPKSATITVTDKSWERNIDVEDYVTVEEKDWQVPDGGRTIKTEQAVHHYDKVVDHYERRSRQVSEQVYDGEDTHTRTVNNGDGTFTEETYTTPRYRTETHTEYYDEPIYRDEPVYRTLYYYEIERWIVVRTETSSGGDDEPYWPEVTYSGNEREYGRNEMYWIAGENVKKKQTFKFTLPFEAWEKLKVGESVKVTYSGGQITKIDGQDVNAA